MQRDTFLTRRTFLKGSFAAAGAVALAPVLAACGGSGKGGSELALDASQRVTIEYLHPLAFASKTIRQLIASFEEANPNITAREQSTEASYQILTQELQAAIAAGNPPAVALVGYDVMRYVADQVPHLNVEDAAQRDPDGEGEGLLNDGFASNVLDLGRVEGVLHFVPYSISNPVLFYNEDALGQVGLDSPPRTWDEVREYARRLTEETDLLGLSVEEGEATFWTLQGLMESNGARLLADSGEGFRCGADTPEAIEATRMLAEMVRQEETASFDRGTTGLENFASGRIAMLVESNGYLSTIQEGASFPFGAAPFPTFGDKRRRVPAGGNTIGIFAEDEDQQAAAWQFVKFLVSPEAMTTWTKGTGYLPSLQGIVEDPQYLQPYFEENPAARAALEQFPDLVPWVSWPGEGLEATQVLVDASDRIFAGGQDVAETLRDAAQRVNRLIQQ
jgi:multiple sugar transport system substrate-binding protein